MQDTFKRIMTLCLAVVLAFGSAIPITIAHTEKADAANYVSYYMTTSYNGASQIGYKFIVQNGVAQGASGTCVDPWSHTISGTVTGTATRVSNSTNTARLAYYFYKNGWSTADTSTYMGVWRSLNMHRALSIARIDDHLYTNRTRAEAWDHFYEMGANQKSYNAVYSMYNDALSKYSASSLPSNFEVYFLDSPSGLQDAIVWRMVPGGSLNLKKVSAIPSYASLPGYNSFAGIKYDLYKSDQRTKVGTFTTGANGVSNTISGLAPGTYYLKEVTANSYYEVNPNWVAATVVTNNTRTVTVSDAPRLGQARIVKASGGDSAIIPTGVHFYFHLVNTSNSNIAFDLRVDGNGTNRPEGVAQVAAGTYRVTESRVVVDPGTKIDGLEVHPEDYANISNTGTVTVAAGQTAALNWTNEYHTPENVLRINKATDDNGPLDGWKFRVEGVLFNQGKITANQVKQTAAPELTLDHEDEYTVGEWSVNADDITALNQAAADSETGDKTVKMTVKLTHKEVEGETPEEIVEALDPTPTEEGEGTIASGTIVSYDEKFYRAVTNVKYEFAFKTEDPDPTPVFDPEGTVENIVALLEDTEKFDEMDISDKTVTLPVKIKLKPVIFINDEYVSRIENPTEDTYTVEGLCEVDYNKFDWRGAATAYKDIATGESYSELITNASGVAMWKNPDGDYINRINQGITPGRFTVTEVMTEAQSAKYRQPASQTQTIDTEEKGDFKFKFVNEAKRTKVKLKKTSPNGVVNNLRFRLTGTTEFGDNVDVTAFTAKVGNEDGIIDFGKLYAGHYVVEEIDFDKTLYINNHILQGHKKPAIEFDVTGVEDEEVVIDFDNLPITSLYLTKIDGLSTLFLENAEFELYEVNGGQEEKVAQFQIVTNDDESAGINMKWVHPDRDITGRMVKTIWENEPTENQDDPEALNDDVIVSDEDSPSSGDTTSGDNQGSNTDDNAGDNTGGNTGNDLDPELLNWAKLQNLEEGQQYVIKEIKAPKGGYTKSQPIAFTFHDNDKIIIKNYIPEIYTTAKDSETNTHVSNADSSVTVIDTVSYKYLEPNTEYTMKGALYYVPDDPTMSILDPVENDGHAIQVEQTFTTNNTGTATAEENPEDMVEMEFTFNGKALAGKSIVVFEDCIKDDKTIASHAEVTDNKQIIKFPEISTQAKRSTSGDSHKIKDTVKLENLVIGQEYALTGTLMDKESGEPFMVDGEPVMSETLIFTAEKEDEERELEFNFTAEDLIGRVGVVFEELTVNDKLVAQHKDIDDEKQTTEWPNPSYNMYKVRNENAPKAKEDGKFGFVWGDKVTYTVVIQNTGNCDLRMDVSDEFEKAEYFTLPKVIDVKNAKQNSISEDENVVNITINAGETAEVIYEATVKTGTPEYLANAAKDSDSLLEGKDCNRVEKDNTPDDHDGYFNHAKTTNVEYKDKDDEDSPWKEFPDGDMTDDAQTPVQEPKIGTTAVGKDTKEHIAMKDKTTIVDTVHLHGLKEDETYTLKGELKDKATGKTIATAEKEFKYNGKDVEMEFTFNAPGNTTYVAFEELYFDDKLIAEHKDINDEAQTVYVPEIGTKANLSNDQSKVVDEIEYKNLIPNRTYVVQGYLVNSKQQKLRGSDGSFKFTPKTANGKVTVELPIKHSANSLAGENLVAFEELYIVKEDDRGVKVAEHKDVNDKNQTVTIKGEKPKTGDVPVLPICGGILLIAGASILLYKRKADK